MPADAEVSLTFGSPASIKEVAKNVGQALSVTFELRDSMYLGGEYYRSLSGWGEVIVQRNDDLGEPAELAHAHLQTLVRVETTRPLEPAVSEALGRLGFNGH
jgi:hypothetical protein